MAFIPDEAVDRMNEISAGAWRLYCFLARRRNQKTGDCFPSVETTMAAIDIKRRHVFGLRKELSEAGWATFDGNNVTALLGFDSAKNCTPNAEKSAKKCAKSAKNNTVKCKKVHAKVQKMTVACKEEPAKLTSKLEPLPDAGASQDGLRQRECSDLFLELYRTVGGYDAPYQFQVKDGVQLAKLLKTCAETRWPMTVAKFTLAARHFFETPRNSHTLADFAAHFSEFYKTAFDRFNKPVEVNGNGRNQVPRNETYGERVSREMEELYRQSADAWAAPVGDSGADSADAEPPWISADFTRLGIA